MNTPAVEGPVGRRWAVVTAVAGTVFIAAGAFWLSFTALADLAARSGIGAGQAWAWPLIVDGIIVVATVAVVGLAGQKAAWYPWVLLVGGAVVSVTANAIHAAVAADADVPALLAASVAAVPPVVLLAITHLTVILTRTPSSPVEYADSVTGTVAATAAAVDLSVARAVPVGADSRGASKRPELSPWRAAPVAIGSGGVPVHRRREAAVTMRGQGWSNRRIARELHVHPSTVGRWFNGAHPPTTSSGAEGARDDTDEDDEQEAGA